MSNYSLTRERAKITIKLVQMYGHADLISYALYVGEKVELSEPRNYKEVLRSKDRDKWMIAIKEELASLEKNNTWSLVKRPETREL